MTMTGEVRKRSVVIAGHRTSVSLESEFWDGLREIARRREISIGQLITEIDAVRQGNLSSALRVFVLKTYRDERCLHDDSEMALAEAMAAGR
ncbi:MAG: ribbon-helix-helix domain-containing protein [Alphaproteobacteria bacterium]